MRPGESKINRAVRMLWVDKDFSKGTTAYQLFEEARDEGNPDAYYFLARCHAGKSYVKPDFGFEVDDEKTHELLDLAIEHGSALAMFSARRFGGYKPKGGSYVHAPYTSEREVWDAVCAEAEQGNLFTKYLVANAYYYGDVVEILGIDLEAAGPTVAVMTIKDYVLIAAKMYEELMAEGLTMGVGNYIDIFESGNYGVLKNPKKVMDAERIAADNGETYYMVETGKKLLDKEPQKAAEYFERALNLGFAPGGLNLGKMYSIGGQLPQDLYRAKHLIEDCLRAGSCTIACNNRLGEIYFWGGNGVDVDYYKAFTHFMEAYKEENYWASDMVGTCYLKGLGTERDYEKALAELSRYPGEKLAIIGLGEIYAYGLGVPQDIKRGMEYWEKLPKDERVLEHKRNFKKTLFGWKQK